MDDFEFRDIEIPLKGQPSSKVIGDADLQGSSSMFYSSHVYLAPVGCSARRVQTDNILAIPTPFQYMRR